MRVVAIGELLIDFAPVGNNEAGYPIISANPGGAPANYLAALAKYGIECGLISKVGNDAFGELLINTMKDCGINTDNIKKDEDTFTTLAFVTLNNGERSFSFARKPGADTQMELEDIDVSMIDEADVLHFGTLSLTDNPSRTTTEVLVNYAKENGKLISFDPNLRKPLWKHLASARSAMLWGLQKADVVKISDDEADFLFGLAPEQAMDYMGDVFHNKLIFVTCGEKGCWYKNKNAKGFVEALKDIEVVDTTGAGDIFGGSAMSAILNKNKKVEELDENDLLDIVRFATAAAGLSTTKHGGISSVASKEEVLEKIQYL